MKKFTQLNQDHPQNKANAVANRARRAVRAMSNESLTAWIEKNVLKPNKAEILALPRNKRIKYIANAARQQFVADHNARVIAEAEAEAEAENSENDY